MTSEAAYHELCYYTLTLGDPAFIHQHVVDAFAAQQADEQTKPIKVTFALVGLYLTYVGWARGPGRPTSQAAEPAPDRPRYPQNAETWRTP